MIGRAELLMTDTSTLAVQAKDAIHAATGATVLMPTDGGRSFTDLLR